MKKYILFFVVLLDAHCQYGQTLYFTQSSFIRIFSEAPLENISATNVASNALIDFDHKEIAVKIPMNKFTFRNKLMQSHFNENYVESTVYPYAIFKGNIDKNIDLTTSAMIPVVVKGTMSMHGVNKMISIEGNLVVDAPSKTVIFDATFKIKIEDYNIKVPSVVMYKIAENIEVNSQFTMMPAKKTNNDISSKK
jgi:hypothetical protein